ncbi:hypothetical protein MHW47_33005 [Streptomyces sp. OfavH-34-F]|uniref:hypothetical protein n=1 Tax=Streptomyces sp. OfavH-34-F TaxID=2917760 RepID=UPI001EF2A36A|nr:hypothetical protein [Streptomyces sp. OfavH-34-F]MCG7529234.1 hypothetical protein [Streptomyces sp. OfavH-34-F]
MTVGDEPRDAVPEGWRKAPGPEPADAPPPPEPEDAAPEPEPQSGEAPRQRAALAVLGLIAALVCCYPVWEVLRAHSSVPDRATATTSPSASVPAARPGPRPDLTTPERIRALIADLERRTGRTEVVSFSVSDGFAWATVPIPGDRERFENHTYGSGRGWSSFTGSGGTDAADSTPVDLAAIDWDVLGGLYRRVDAELGFPTRPRRTLRLKAGLAARGPFRATPPALSVELDDHTRIGWVEARVDGTVTEVHKPVRYAFSAPPRPDATGPAGPAG